MKSTLLLFSGALLFLHAPASAQLLAGEVPDGMSALDVNATISLAAPFTADSVALEFDCDDFHDAWAVLFRGAPEVDGPNIALLRFVDDDIEVCASLTPPSLPRPRYHAFGEPLDCAGDHDWQGGNAIVLGDFGGFIAVGPVTVDHLYIGYRRGAQMGWMLLSFDVQGGLNDVILQVHELLPLCPGTMSVGEPPNDPGITLYPNPGSGENIRVESAEAIRSIEVLDAAGRILELHEGNLLTIPSPAIAGTYLMRATSADGHRSTQRWVRH